MVPWGAVPTPFIGTVLAFPDLPAFIRGSAVPSYFESELELTQPALQTMDDSVNPQSQNEDRSKQRRNHYHQQIREGRSHIAPLEEFIRRRVSLTGLGNASDRSKA